MGWDGGERRGAGDRAGVRRSAGADDWLAGLPELVERLQRDWSITVGATYEDATEAYVAAASSLTARPPCSRR